MIGIPIAFLIGGLIGCFCKKSLCNATHPMAKFIIGGIIGVTIFGNLLLICYLFCGKKDSINVG
jgi:hypothetical protein